MEENKNIQNEQSTETSATEACAKCGFFANKKNIYIVAAIAAVAIVAGIVLAVVLGGKDTPVNDDNNDNGGEVGDIDKPEIEENTTGAVIYDAVSEILADNADATAIDIANPSANSGMLPFMAGAMEVEVGSEYFAGFDNYAIEGYKSAACFMPMMGSIAFVGYVFELEDGVDAAAFKADLIENCNPRWNICVEADQTVCEEINGKILFLMCPSDALSEGGEGDMSGEPSGDVVYPITLEEGTFGYANWTIFEDAMIEGELTTSIELANAIVNSGILPFMAGAMEIEVGTEYFAGFDNYTIEGYKSAACFMPMMGSIAYVGYIFEVEDGIDIYNFIADLTENCNPRWNICVEAEETLVGAFGNKVFFLMCPISAE